MPRIITLYIWREVTTPFLLGILVVTLTVLLGKLLKLIELVINKGLGFTTLLKLIAFPLPFFLTYIVPIVFLIAVIVTYNRLSGNGEIIALANMGLKEKSFIADFDGLTIYIDQFSITRKEQRI